MEDVNDNLPTELEDLKDRADVIGLKYRKDITVDNLRSKIAEALADKEPANVSTAKEPSANDQRFSLRQKASELVRVRITCMDPNKREYDGDIFCAGNRVIGTFKKYVPFDTEWHVPRVILNMIKRKQCQVFVSKRDERGRQKREGKMIKAYAVEELAPLTESERKDLANRQAMAKGTATA